MLQSTVSCSLFQCAQADLLGHPSSDEGCVGQKVSIVPTARPGPQGEIVVNIQTESTEESRTRMVASVCTSVCRAHTYAEHNAAILRDRSSLERFEARKSNIHLAPHPSPASCPSLYWPLQDLRYKLLVLHSPPRVKSFLILLTPPVFR